MSQIMTSNVQLLSQLNASRSRVNGNVSLRLISGEVDLSPAMLVTDIPESSFTGYARKNLVGQWGAIFKVRDGLYQVDSTVQTFTPTADDVQKVGGWFICDNTTLLYAATFGALVDVVDGVPISFVLSLQEGEFCNCPG